MVHSKFALLFRKDMLCIWRAKSLIVATASFSLMLVVVASFAFRQIGQSATELQALTPGIIWLIFLFSAVVGLNYSFLSEREESAMHGVLLSSVSPAVFYLSKFTSNLLFLVFIQALVIFSHCLLFGVSLAGGGILLLGVTLLSAVGFTALGTLLSAMAVYSRAREVLLPLMLFPLSIPLISASVILTREVMQTGSIELGGFWFLLVCGFDVISLVLAWALFEHVIR